MECEENHIDSYSENHRKLSIFPDLIRDLILFFSLESSYFCELGAHAKLGGFLKLFFLLESSYFCELGAPCNKLKSYDTPLCHFCKGVVERGPPSVLADLADTGRRIRAVIFLFGCCLPKIISKLYHRPFLEKRPILAFVRPKSAF